eukprot:Opistho-2@26187
MAELAALVSRLEAVTARLEGLSKGGAAPASSGAGASGPVAPFVEEYDEIVSGPLKKYLDLANDIGGDVKTHADSVQKAFAAQRVFPRDCIEGEGARCQCSPGTSEGHVRRHRRHPGVPR